MTIIQYLKVIDDILLKRTCTITVSRTDTTAHFYTGYSRMCALRAKTPRTHECLERFALWCSEQGTVSLVPLCGYPLKAKGVTPKVTPFVYFAVLRTTPERGGLF